MSCLQEARADPVAHGDARVVVALGEGCRELGAVDAPVRDDRGKAAVKADDAAEVELFSPGLALADRTVGLRRESGTLPLAWP